MENARDAARQQSGRLKCAESTTRKLQPEAKLEANLKHKGNPKKSQKKTKDKPQLRGWEESGPNPLPEIKARKKKVKKHGPSGVSMHWAIHGSWRKTK